MKEHCIQKAYDSLNLLLMALSQGYSEPHVLLRCLNPHFIFLILPFTGNSTRSKKMGSVGITDLPGANNSPLVPMIQTMQRSGSITFKAHQQNSLGSCSVSCVFIES